MDYPDGYNVPAFPAGKPLAVARWMGIAIQLVYVLVIASCGMILWAAHSRTINPTILSVNNLTGQWEQITQTNGPKEYSYQAMVQIAAISKFVQNWFLITPYTRDDEARWKRCAASECPTNDTSKYAHLSGDESCTIFCSTNADLFNKFEQDVVPVYRALAETGQYWMLDTSTLQITPTNTPMLWQVFATIKSTAGDFDILAYAIIGHSPDRYISTAGFYVTDFKAYRLK